MLKNYFTTQYLLSSTAPTNQRLFLIIIGIFVLSIVVSILLSYNQNIHPGLKNRLFNFCLTIGILGLIISFFRYESIPYVGSRLVMLMLFATIIIWYLAITIYSVSKMPREIRAIKNHERYIQYLPKKKKK